VPGQSYKYRVKAVGAAGAESFGWSEFSESVEAGAGKLREFYSSERMKTCVFTGDGCPGDCHGHGQCVGTGVCACNTGWASRDR